MLLKKVHNALDPLVHPEALPKSRHLLGRRLAPELSTVLEAAHDDIMQQFQSLGLVLHQSVGHLAGNLHAKCPCHSGCNREGE